MSEIAPATPDSQTISTNTTASERRCRIRSGASDPGRGRGGHIIRPAAPETRVGGGELNPIHQDHGGYVNPQQEHNDCRDRSVNQCQPRIVADVPGEPIKGEPPQNAGQDGPDPDVPESRFGVGNEIKDKPDADD